MHSTSIEIESAPESGTRLRTESPWPKVRAEIYRALGVPTEARDEDGPTRMVSGAAEDAAALAMANIADKVDAWNPGEPIGPLLAYARKAARNARIDVARSEKTRKGAEEAFRGRGSGHGRRSGGVVEDLSPQAYRPDETQIDKLPGKAEVLVDRPLDREINLAALADWVRPALRNPNLSPAHRRVVELLISQPSDLMILAGDEPVDIFLRELTRDEAAEKKRRQREDEKRRIRDRCPPGIGGRVPS